MTNTFLRDSARVFSDARANAKTSAPQADHVMVLKSKIMIT